MGFVRSVVSPGETLIVHSHPHWRALVRPGLVTVIGAGLAGIAGGFIETQVVHSGDRAATWAMVAGIYLLVVLRFGLWPALRWARTSDQSADPFCAGACFASSSSAQKKPGAPRASRR